MARVAPPHGEKKSILIGLAQIAAEVLNGDS